MRNSKTSEKMKDYFSVSDVERFAYCPLNYLLYLEGVRAESSKGEEYHKGIMERISANLILQSRTNYLNKAFFFISVFTLFPLFLFFYDTLVGKIDFFFILLVSLVTIYISIWFYLLSTYFDLIKYKNVDGIILFFTLSSLFFLFFAIVILKLSYFLIPILILSADLLLLVESFIYYNILKNVRIISKLPKEEKNVQYHDDGEAELLVSEKWGLRGRPDILAEIEGEIVPVEIKSSNKPKVRPFSHVMQLTAYAVLVEEVYGRQVNYGILKYPQGDIQIEIDENIRLTLASMLERMQEVKTSRKAHRNHNNVGKCMGCYRRDKCPEALG